MSTVTLDLRRLLCPMPVIRVQDKVAELSPGTRIEAVCTDPGALHDIPAWCRLNGHTLIETRSGNGEYIAVLEVGAPPV